MQLNSLKFPIKRPYFCLTKLNNTFDDANDPNNSWSIIFDYYDGGQVIAEYDINDTLLHKLICGPGIDEPICTIDVTDGNTVYYYHFDGLGSVVALSDVNSVIAERYYYDVFVDLFGLSKGGMTKWEKVKIAALGGIAGAIDWGVN